MKCALGAGWRFYGDDWEHVDGGDYTHCKNYDLFKLPYNNESVDLLYCSHLIAYFTRDEFVRLLREWYRVLKKGGILRIATPDFTAMSKLYFEKKIKLKEILGPLYGQMRMGNKMIYHKTCWDYSSIHDILDGEFFENIREYDHRKTDHFQTDDHSAAYLKGTLISLNVECQK